MGFIPIEVFEAGMPMQALMDEFTAPSIGINPLPSLAAIKI